MSFLLFSLRMAVVFALCALPAASQNIDMEAAIPFDFEVSNVLLPAGEYRVVQDLPPGIVAVRSVDGNARALLLVGSRGTPRDAKLTFELVFHRYRNGSEARSFLRTIRHGWTRTELMPTRAERQAEADVRIAKGTRTEVVILAKSLR